MSKNTEKLITVVKKHPILYDLSHQEYKNIRKKDKVWDELGIEMNENGAELKKRWKNLRDTYAKYLRSKKPKTGQARKNYKQWQWAPLMEPFRTYMAFAKTESNVSQLEEDASQTQDLSQSAEATVDSDIEDNFSQFEEGDTEKPNDWINPESQTSGHTSTTETQSHLPTLLPDVETTKKRKCTTNKAKRSVSSVDTVLDYLQNKRARKEFSPTELIFLGYAQTIETFLPKFQATTKCKIAQIIMEQELLNQDAISNTRNQLHSRASSSASSYTNVSMDSPLEPIGFQDIQIPSSFMHTIYE